MQEEISGKYIDDSKQGEALMMPFAKPKNIPSKKLYLESYGCQMNFSDSEIVASIMSDNGYETTNIMEDADAIFINTCAIRDNAEQKIRGRLRNFTHLKKAKPSLTIGVLVCMAERLKKQLLEEEKMVDIVAGPDSYRDLPNLISEVYEGHKAVNVFLSREETYADISPVRLDSTGISAFITIMRGCDNMCSFCVVPFTRGRERSRDPKSIVAEAQDLFNRGYREVTLLGQNVDSYKYTSNKEDENEEVISFAKLLRLVANVSPLLRVRFSTSHPKDITEEVMIAMVETKNICNYIHLPVQSGNSRVLELMNRTYTREWYLDRINMMKSYVPDLAISSDIIAGFCTETEEEHQDTLSIMELVKYDYAYSFAYSERPGTPAAKKLLDDISPEVKLRRLNEIQELQRQHSLESNQKDIGKTFEVLVEGRSKKSADFNKGRNDQNKMIVFPKEDSQAGQYIYVKVLDCNNATLMGQIVPSPIINN